VQVRSEPADTTTEAARRWRKRSRRRRCRRFAMRSSSRRSSPPPGFNRVCACVRPQRPGAIAPIAPVSARTERSRSRFQPRQPATDTARTGAAIEAYRQCITAHPGLCAIALNLGNLLAPWGGTPRPPPARLARRRFPTTEAAAHWSDASWRGQPRRYGGGRRRASPSAFSSPACRNRARPSSPTC